MKNNSRNQNLLMFFGFNMVQYIIILQYMCVQLFSESMSNILSISFLGSLINLDSIFSGLVPVQDLDTILSAIHHDGLDSLMFQTWFFHGSVTFILQKFAATSGIKTCKLGKHPMFCDKEKKTLGWTFSSACGQILERSAFGFPGITWKRNDNFRKASPSKKIRCLNP